MSAEGQIKLKPCPFCGGTPERRDCLRGYVYVACSECHVEGPALRGADIAAEHWNRRHQDQDTSSEFERLLSK